VLKPYEALADEKLVEKAFASNVAVRYLVSDEPSSQLSDELATFGQFVGSWDLTMDSITPEGVRTELVGEWHFGWALHGRAVQDVLITRTLDGELAGYGTTVRTYDDRDGKWWIVWQDPIAHEFAVLFARPAGSRRIELEGQWPGAAGSRFRWVFSRITPSTFHWEALLLEDDGGSWRVIEVMKARRREETSGVPESRTLIP
jgi:hypothetical protein